VVVVRGTPGSAEAPILLGVDGSSGAQAAAEAAFAQARRRRTELLVVRHQPPHTSRAEAEAAAMGHDLRRLADSYPDVKWRTEEVRGGDGASTALMDAAVASGAGLVVVGSRGLNGFRAMVMGSTSRTLIEHAPCPVMVVPSTVHQA
jgi:nucleotide-binding universal stress UspA family protein